MSIGIPLIFQNNHRSAGFGTIRLFIFGCRGIIGPGPSTSLDKSAA